MEWQVSKKSNFMLESVVEHQLNNSTKVFIRKYDEKRKVTNKGFTYMISSSCNLYRILRDIPISEDDMFYENSILTNSSEQADLILDLIKEKAEKIKEFDSVIMYLAKDSIERFESGEIAQGWFHPRENCIPYEVKDEQVLQLFLNNPGADLLKSSWTEEIKMEYFEECL